MCTTICTHMTQMDTDDCNSQRAKERNVLSYHTCENTQKEAQSEPKAFSNKMA